MPLYVTYRRVSVDERVTGSCSLDWQYRECSRYLEKLGAVEEVDYCDDGTSASIPLRERKQGRNLFNLSAGQDYVIVAAKTDRVFRSVEDMAITCRMWRDRNIQFVSATEGFDLQTVFGRFQFQILCCFAELEREMIADRTRQANATRKASGMRVAAEAPYGWKYAGETIDADGRKSGGILEECKEEQKVLERMASMKKQGSSLRAIAGDLLADGFLTRAGKPWAHTSIKHVLLQAQAYRKLAGQKLKSSAKLRPKLVD
jgi:DNA invertase Pin-like site-specific DNA recombinase